MATSNPASRAVEAGTIASATSSAAKSEIFRVVLPYAVAIAAQLPLFLLYYRWLMTRAHYSSWCLFAVLATAILVWARWPRGEKQVFVESLWSNILLVAGLLAGLMGVLFVDTWFAALSVFTLLTSLLARTIDRETGHSLWILTLPLYVSLALPLNLDMTLITWLQSSSAFLTSRMLDLVGIPHHMPGTAILTPEKDFGIEEMCSGVQSFFLLIFVSVTYCVWLRRPLFRSLLLLISAVFWATMMNCLRIFLIPLVYFRSGFDLSEGVQHDLLGWSTMALGILLLLSTDQFLMFLFGPVDVATGSSGPMGKFITNVWNFFFSGKSEDEKARSNRRSRRKPLSQVSWLTAWVAAAVMTLGGVYSLWDIRNAYASAKRINFFQADVTYRIGENGLPEVLNDWRVVPESYRFDRRTRGSDLGEQSEGWLYMSPNRFVVHTSLDQPFPGWHELTKCYKNDGWTMKKENRILREWNGKAVDGSDESWPYIEAHFEKPTGERGMLLFSLFDGFGKPFEAPTHYDYFTHLMQGAQNRLNERARARLFQSEAYQTQVFMQGYSEFSKEVRDEVTDRYLEIREVMRKKFLEAKESAKGSSGVPVNADQDSSDADVQ